MHMHLQMCEHTYKHSTSRLFGLRLGAPWVESEIMAGFCFELAQFVGLRVVLLTLWSHLDVGIWLVLSR